MWGLILYGVTPHDAEPLHASTVSREVRRSVGVTMDNGSGNTGLALIVGGLVVVVVLFFVFGGVDIFPGGGDRDIDVSLETPAPTTPAQ